MRTEAWWVCSCGTKIYKVGSGRGKKWEQHLPTCSATNPGVSIKQLPQKKF